MRAEYTFNLTEYVLKANTYLGVAVISSIARDHRNSIDTLSHNNS